MVANLRCELPGAYVTMILDLTGTAMRLNDASDFKKFKAIASSDADLSRMTQDGLSFEGSHCWIAVSLVKKLGQSEDPMWLEQFERMVQGAAKHGFVSADGSKIRAHIEFSN